MTKHSDYINEDIIVACADLVGRSGGREFEIGCVHDDVPVEEAGWYANVKFKGARIQATDHRSPTAAALALAERILKGGVCRCGKLVTLNDGTDGCRWKLNGKKWEPGCDAEPIHVKGERGDVNAMRQSMEQQLTNRAQRRAAERRRRKK